jgi:hypothetical protein
LELLCLHKLLKGKHRKYFSLYILLTGSFKPSLNYLFNIHFCFKIKIEHYPNQGKMAVDAKEAFFLFGQFQFWS